MATAEHDYSRYSTGCRCDVCRAAKAAYMRAQRAKAAQARDTAWVAGGRYHAEGITHGLNGYQNHCCRCTVCRLAKSARYAGGAR